MSIVRDRVPFPSMRPILLADTAVELAIGAALLGWRDECEAWFSLPGVAVVAVGAVFILAAVLVGALMAMPQSWRPVVPGLAAGNTVGGIAGWIALFALWGALEPEGRWLLAAASDTFLALGIAEFLSLRAGRLGRSG